MSTKPRIAKIQPNSEFITAAMLDQYRAPSEFKLDRFL